MEIAFNGNVAKGLGEPYPASKQHKRRRASLDMMNEDFTVKEGQQRPGEVHGGAGQGHRGEQENNQEVRKKTSRRTKSDLGRSMVGLAWDIRVNNQEMRRKKNYTQDQKMNGQVAA